MVQEVQVGFAYEGAILHCLTSLVDYELSVPEERLGVLPEPEMDYAEVVFDVPDIPCFHQVRIPLLLCEGENVNR